MKCFNLKRVSAYILAICLISQMFPITANAASKQFKETAKAGVPLRYAVGSENAIVARIEDQGVAVEIFEHTQNVIGPKKRTTWYKISVEEGYTNNGLHGVFWVYGGNLCAHEHKMVAGRCTKPGCTVDYNDFETTKVDCTLKITRDDAPIRALPYNDGEVLQRKNTGECVSAVASLTNYKGSKWYQLASGSYIFSGNVKVATEIDKVVTNNSIINASGSGSSGSGGAGGSDGSSGSKPTFGDIIDDFIIYEPAPCTKHKWSVGVCTSCGTQWKLNITPVQATFRIKEDDISARNIPYKQGKVMRQFEAGALVSITGKAQNSAKNTWYQTDEGYWIYSDNLLDVSAKKMYLSSSGYTFTESGQTLQVRPRYEPEGAVILSEEWSSSNENVATVQDGLITAIGDVQDTKAIITCIATSAEGAVLKAEMQVVVPVSVNWDVWEYDNDVFNYDLALECSALMCLAYPRYDYTYHKGELIVFECGGESIEPKNLLRLLKDKGMNYQVSYNYYNKRRDNSPYVLASKYVTYNGKTTPLVYVIIEGSAGLPGWEGNMMVSGSSYKEVTDHQTFKKSAENIHEGIRAYIQQFDSLGEKPLIVVTGHSRGAAVANLLAHDLGRDTKVGDVYAYTFATPNATTKPVADNYIFNICNQLDFVAYIPLSSNYGSKWGFAKHGTTYSFDAQNLLKNNKKFKSIMQEQVAISSNYRNFDTPDYRYMGDTPLGLASYMSGKWPKLNTYYQRNSDPLCTLSPYEYMFDGLASAASNGSKSIVLQHWHILERASPDTYYRCNYTPLSAFFVGNGAEFASALGTVAFADSHEAYTYHAAMLSGGYDDGGTAWLFSSEKARSATVQLDPDEYETLMEFFAQEENELMLELAGWDLADPSTWDGVLWDDSGHIFDLDLSYMDLGGWLDVSSLEALESLNIDGNEISMLAVSGCDNLQNLSCYFNQLTSLSVNECSNLQNLNCAYNAITSLDVGGMEQLQQLSCFGNQISNLNLSGATGLSELRCSDNMLSNLDISTNTSLQTLYLRNNRIVESQNPELATLVGAINGKGGSADIGAQQYIEGYDFNADELASLMEFASTSRNLEKLDWDLEDPWSWNGVEWKIYGDEYHIVNVSLDNMSLEGDFNLPAAEYLESLSVDNAGLSSLNLSGCTSVTSINCYNAGLSLLEISGCTSLISLNCDENYLEVEEVESALNQIGLQTGLINYEKQNIAADEENFNENERQVLIDFLSTADNASALNWDIEWPGTWNGVIWTKDDEGSYRVNKLNFAELPVEGSLDLTGFDYLEDFAFSGTNVERVFLPDTITQIPQYAFYGSGIEFIYMMDGVDSIGGSAFAYCEDLRTIILPKTVTRIGDNAFGGSAVKNAVFLGDEPLAVGSNAFLNTSPEFSITYFAETNWDEESAFLSQYVCKKAEAPFVLLLDGDIVIDETEHDPTNIYAGHDIPFIVVAKENLDTAVCMLAVYNENGAMVESYLQSVQTEQSITEIVFSNINLKYASEEYCQFNIFLLDGDQHFVPIAETVHQIIDIQ